MRPEANHLDSRLPLADQSLKINIVLYTVYLTSWFGSHQKSFKLMLRATYIQGWLGIQFTHFKSVFRTWQQSVVCLLYALCTYQFSFLNFTFLNWFLKVYLQLPLYLYYFAIYFILLCLYFDVYWKDGSKISRFFTITKQSVPTVHIIHHDRPFLSPPDTTPWNRWRQQ